jgi:hypothetical protein
MPQGAQLALEEFPFAGVAAMFQRGTIGRRRRISIADPAQQVRAHGMEPRIAGQ